MDTDISVASGPKRSMITRARDNNSFTPRHSDFYCEYGFMSCFECDEIFTDMHELQEHEDKHREEEQCLK